MTSENTNDSDQQPKPQGDRAADSSRKGTSEEVWALENAFPDAIGLLTPSRRFTAAESNVLVVLDTNALLLPLTVSKQELPEIEKVYKALANEGRLFVPGRALREFVRKRDSRLAEIAQGLREKASPAAGKIDIPPILEGLTQTEVAKSAFDELQKAQKKYVEATGALADLIGEWRSDDPVTSIYRKLFQGDAVVELDQDRPELEREWFVRLKQKVPPGYKDGAKSDTGIGDFLIWLSLLKLAKTHEKDLIFVTGEEKSDWFVRSKNTAVYPRPELIAEYRKHSNGKDIHLAKLADVLQQMKAPEAVVSEVRTAELTANNAIQAASFSPSPSHEFASFDYSTDNGRIVLGSGEASLSLRFAKASDARIQLVKAPDNTFIARLKNTTSGQVIQADDFDQTSSIYRIENGEAFLARSNRGYTLVGRIVSIADDRFHDAPEDNVSFLYSIYAPGQQMIAP